MLLKKWKGSILNRYLAFILYILLIYGCGAGTTTTPATGTAPSTPTGVTPAAGDGQVTINWGSVSGATSYNLYMATQSGVTKSNYSTLTSGMKHTDITSTSYTHTGLTNGTIYYFVVTTVNSAGESTESSQVYATPSIFTGTWKTTINGTLFSGESGQGEATTITYIITQSTVTASFTDTKGRSGTWTITGSMSGNIFSGQSTDLDPACASRTVTYTITVSGNTMTESGSGPAAGSCPALTYTFTYTRQ